MPPVETLFDGEQPGTSGMTTADNSSNPKNASDRVAGPVAGSSHAVADVRRSTTIHTPSLGWLLALDQKMLASWIAEYLVSLLSMLVFHRIYAQTW